MTKIHKQETAPRGEVLIALLKEKSDFAILQDQGWYRIPGTGAAQVLFSGREDDPAVEPVQEADLGV